MRRLATTVLLTAVLISGIAATALASSGAGAINLSFPIGARYNSLGEAGTALSQDATAMWWNPGGLAFLPGRAEPHDLQIMQSSLAEGLADDIGLYWVGYAMPMGNHGALGFNINYLDMGEQQGRDENGVDTGTFRSYMFALSATYGVQVGRTLGVGLGVKYFRDKLADDQFTQDSQAGGGSGDSFGVDLGLLWKAPRLRSNFGLAVANLGPDIVHVDSDQSDPMPRKMTLGWAFSVYNSEYMGILLVADYLVPLYKWKGTDYGLGLEWDQYEYGVGAEWNYLRSLYVRFGYKATYPAADIKDTTFGFGVDMKRWLRKAITFDYASVPQAQGLDRVNRLSLGYRF
ncbi:MAG: PorV/PorQ family protein [bacterium]|nr:PorV/PorQ family protein [bacterium]